MKNKNFTYILIILIFIIPPVILFIKPEINLKQKYLKFSFKNMDSVEKHLQSYPIKKSRSGSTKEFLLEIKANIKEDLMNYNRYNKVKITPFFKIFP